MMKKSYSFNKKQILYFCQIFLIIKRSRKNLEKLHYEPTMSYSLLETTIDIKLLKIRAKNKNKYHCKINTFLLLRSKSKINLLIFKTNKF